MNEKELGDLYPELTDEEQKTAAENLDLYLELAWEIFEEAQVRERGDLTGTGANPKIQGKVDSSIN